jgi:hypothetical protein
LEDWTYGRTLSGAPQGGICSPILSNLYLDRLDRWVSDVLVSDYTRGDQRRRFPPYHRLKGRRQRARKRGDVAQDARLGQQMRRLPCHDPHDPTYRRLRYVRYADDFLLGFAGPRDEAEEIKRRIGEFLRDTLKLELSDAKTLVTHGRTGAARFLGYDLVVHHDDTRLARRPNGIRTRTLGRNIGLKVPPVVVRDKVRAYTTDGKPVHRAERLHDDAFSIVAQYEAEFRGLADYYRLAYNLHRLHRLRWVMGQSLAKTLATKYRVRVTAIWRRHRVTIATERGPRVVLRITRERDGKPPLVATWGQTDLVRRTGAVLDDAPAPVWNRGAELVQRLLADTCELCGSHDAVQVHHVRALKDLNRPGRRDTPPWMRVMAARHRKTLVVCHACHVNIHAGRPPRRREATGLESRVR